MKVLPFAVRQTITESFQVQVDKGKPMYDRLHSHPALQLTYIKNGEGELIAGNFVGRFRAGDVFILGPGQSHVFKSSPRSIKRNQVHAISILFEKNILGDFFMALPELRMAQIFFKNCEGGFQIVGKSKERIIEALQALPKARNIARIILFLEILRAVADLKTKKPLARHSFHFPINQYDNQRIKKVVDYTFKNSQDSIRLSDIAQIAGMTREAFCKYFKERTNKTYISFLNEVRIHNACKLLMQGGPTVSAVGGMAGFNNLTNFNRVFKKIMGMTPVDYINVSLEIR